MSWIGRVGSPLNIPTFVHSTFKGNLKILWCSTTLFLILIAVTCLNYQLAKPWAAFNLQFLHIFLNTSLSPLITIIQVNCVSWEKINCVSLASQLLDGIDNIYFLNYPSYSPTSPIFCSMFFISFSFILSFLVTSLSPILFKKTFLGIF